MPQAATRPRVWAVLVTYRRNEVARATLATVLRQTRPPDHTWIVNNDVPGACDDFGEHRPTVTVVDAPENLGPPAGYAYVLPRIMAAADDDDWVLLLDDDDPPHADTTLERLLEFAGSVGEHDPLVGAVGLAGARYDRRRGRAERIPDSELSGPVAVDGIGGSQLPLVRVAALRAAGLPDGDLFFGWEEIDFHLRVKAAGWSVYADGDTWHELRDERGRAGLTAADLRDAVPPPWRAYYDTRNQITIARRHGGPLAGARGLVDGSARVARALSRRQWPLAAAHLRGLRDGVLGRLGRRVDPAR